MCLAISTSLKGDHPRLLEWEPATPRREPARTGFFYIRFSIGPICGMRYGKLFGDK
jgi:hypothetical protein